MKTRVLTAPCSIELARQVRRAAGEMDMTVAEFIRQCLQEGIKRMQAAQNIESPEPPTVINNNQSGMSKAEFTHTVDNIIIEALKV